MPNETFANNAPSNTVSAGYSAGTTTIVMNAVSGYPASPQFRLLNQRTGEIVLVTGAVGTTLTLQRGVEGSSAQALNAGDSFVHILTGGALVALVGPIQQTTVTNAATIVISNLNLSADGGYELEFSGVWNGSFANSTQCVLLPNGGVPSNVNGFSHRAYTSSQDMGGSPLTTILLFLSDFSTGGGGLEVWFRCRMRWGATGRKIFEIDNLFTGSATQVLWAKNMVVWHDTATNIISVTINPNAGTLTGTVKLKPVR